MFNYNIFTMEFRRSLKGLIGWTISIGLTMYLIIVLYPMVKDLYSEIPAEYLDFYNNFGGIPKNVMEYFATECGMMLQIFGAIYAAMLGFSIISREEREQATDIVYTLPVSRNKFFYTKLISAFSQIIIFTLFVCLFSVLGFVTINSKTNYQDFFVFFAFYTIMLLMITSLGFAMACLIKRNSKSSLALIIPLPLYLLTLISSLLDKDSIFVKIKYLSPFTFSDPVRFLKDNAAIEIISLLFFLGISIISIIFSSYIFNKKEFKN